MLSVVLYGRNDSHGYNLHKRAALGLNCLAEVLTDDDDEILFVDYNTPDDYPTFPEAIADTLTARAAARLRVLRVRPVVHARFRARTRLAALEPIARNIAVRRSNPRNRWILSTNTDMIFVPRSARSLSEVSAGLPTGLYHLPRFELPELLWEGLDRRDPTAAVDALRVLGPAMFLDEVVHGPAYVRYDAPGDFQLVPRDDLFRIQGFDEGMLLGWHVDANLSRRLHLLYGEIGDVAGAIAGYHCSHTRQVTPAHAHRAETNSFRRCVEDVLEPGLPAQALSWGLPDEAIEEVHLRDSIHRAYVRTVREVLAGESGRPADATLAPDTYGRTRYDARHVLPFVTDLLATAPRRWSAAWIGARADSFALFHSAWRSLGFTGPVLVPAWAWGHLAPLAGAGARSASDADLAAFPDVLLVDFGAPSDATAPQPGAPADADVDAHVRRTFSALVTAERGRLAGGSTARRFICIGAVHNVNERLVLEEISAAATPFTTRLRHGFVKPTAACYADAVPTGTEPGPAPNLVHSMEVGESGERTRAGVVAPFGRRGVVLHGPHAPLPAGVYRAEVSVAAHTAWSLAAMVRPVIVDIAAGTVRLARRRARFLLRATIRVPFTIPAELGGRAPVHLSVFRGRSVGFTVTGVRLRRLAAPRDDDSRRTPSEDARAIMDRRHASTGLI